MTVFLYILSAVTSKLKQELTSPNIKVMSVQSTGVFLSVKIQVREVGIRFSTATSLKSANIGISIGILLLFYYYLFIYYFKNIGFSARNK